MKKAMIFSLVLIFGILLLACSEDEPEIIKTDVVSQETSETIPPDYLNNLSTATFPGKTYTIIGKYSVGSAQNFPEETETGEVVNDALYQRDRAIEERYGITFNYVHTDSGGTTVSKAEADVMAGGTTYNMIQGSMLTCTNVLLNKGLLTKINDLDYIDVSQSWWNSRCESDLAINGNFYYITGVMMYEHYNEASCIMFNKTMVEDYGIEDLYSLVEKGEWTFDKMAETAKVISPMSDHYRFGLNDISGYGFYFGAGLRITYFDKESTPYFEPDVTVKMADVIDKYSAVFADESISVNNTYNWENSITLEKGGSDNYFTSGLVLFQGATTGHVVGWRGEELDFGILPMPKYDVNQSGYISYANPWSGSSIAFPILLEDPDMTGLIAEALAYESKIYLEPAMYDNLLKTRGARDQESEEMLNIIYNSKTFDLCDICEWGGLNYSIRNNVLGASDTLVSDYAAIITSANIALNETIEMFRK